MIGEAYYLDSSVSHPTSLQPRSGQQADEAPLLTVSVYSSIKEMTLTNISNMVINGAPNGI